MALPPVGSGLDIPSISNQLADADTKSASDRIARDSQYNTTLISAMGQIKSTLSTFQSSLASLVDVTQFYSKSSTVSNTTIVQATVSNKVANGLYQLKVSQLAQKHSIASQAFTDKTTSIGNGTLTITLGTYGTGTFTPNPDKAAVNITIQPGSDNLTAIRDAINNSKAGVSASIIQDNSGYHLTITSQEMGSNNAIQIKVTDNDGNNTDSSGLSSFAYQDDTGVHSMLEKAAAQDSSITFNGINLNYHTNTINDIIDGLNLNLLNTSPGTETVTISVSDNKDQVSSKINAFVTQFNATMSLLTSLTGYNAAAKTRGILQGDSDLRTLMSTLKSWATEPIPGSKNKINSLSDLGITTDRYTGLLKIDSKMLTSAMDNHFDELSAIFAKTATSSDAGLSVTDLQSSVKAGSYDVNLSAFTPGTTLTGTIGGLEAFSNDGYTLKGTGNLRGMAVAVSSGSTGSRGTITVTDGVAARLNNLMTSYLDSSGSLTNRTKQLNAESTKLQKEAIALQEKHDMLFKRYKTKFAALDQLMADFQKTHDFLSSQLSNLPKLTLK